MTTTAVDDSACITVVRKDLDLVAAVRAGDSDAYSILFKRYRVPALRCARRHTRSAEIAEDAVMDAFIRIYLALRKQEGPTSSFRAYLFAAVKHAVVELLSEARHFVLVPASDEIPHGAAPSPEGIVHERAETAERRQQVEHVLRLLPDRWRQVLELTALDERPIAEVAEMLGLSGNATSALAWRARRGYRMKLGRFPAVA